MMEIIREEAKKCTDELLSPIDKFNKIKEETERIQIEEKRKQDILHKTMTMLNTEIEILKLKSQKQNIT